MDTKKLRQKILDLAIRGKLVPQDPNDEPASVLLERIREEKKQMVKEGKLKAKDIKNDTIIFKGEDNLHYEKFQDGAVKCIEDEIPFEVPEGWEWCRYRNVIDLYSGQDLVPDRYNSEHRGIPYITGASNLDNGHIILNRWTDSPTTHATINDLLLTCKGSGVGKMAICNIEDVHIARQIMALRCTSAINVLYLQVAVTSTIDEIKQLANGIIPGITREVVLSTLMPLPPYREQCNIGEKVGAVCELIDNVEDEKIALSDVISATKDRVLDLAIRGQLVPQDTDDESASVLLERIREEKENLIKKGKLKRDKKESIIYKGDDNSYYEKSISGESCNISEEIPFELPEAWTWCRLKTVVQIINGDRGANYPAKNKLHDSGIPFVSASNIDDGIVSHSSGMKYLSEEQYNLLRAGLLQINDIVYCIRGSLGKCGIFPYEKGAIASSLVIVRPYLEQESMTAYLMLYLASTLSFSEIKKYDNGTAQPNLAAKDFENFLIPLPPLKMIAKIVCKATQLLDELSIVQEAL